MRYLILIAFATLTLIVTPASAPASAPEPSLDFLLEDYFLVVAVLADSQGRPTLYLQKADSGERTIAKCKGKGDAEVPSDWECVFLGSSERVK